MAPISSSFAWQTASRWRSACRLERPAYPSISRRACLTGWSCRRLREVRESPGLPGLQVVLIIGSLDHLVGEGEQLVWNLEAERLGGLEIDHQLELGWLHHRQVGGFLAFENAPHIDPSLAIAVRVIGSVADEATRGHEFPLKIHHWDRITRCQFDKLIPPGGKEWIGADDERAGMLLHHGREGRIDVGFRAAGEHDRCHVKAACRGLKFRRLELGLGIVRIDEGADHGCVRHQFAQEAELLRVERGREQADAGDVAAWSTNARNETGPDRIGRAVEDDWDFGTRGFCRQKRYSRRRSVLAARNLKNSDGQTSSKNCSLNRDVECPSVGTIFAHGFSERSAHGGSLTIAAKEGP